MNSGGSIEMSDEQKMPTEIAAQLWCLPKHANKTMDIELCQDIAKAIHRAQAQARRKTTEDLYVLFNSYPKQFILSIEQIQSIIRASALLRDETEK